MTTGAPAPRRRYGARAADLLVLLLCAASIFAVSEMALRPFYPAPPPLLLPQVRLRHSARYGWEPVPDRLAHSFDVSAPIDERGHRIGLLERDVADSSARRWLLLGGGTAFGVGVPGADCFAAVAARAGDSGAPVRLVSAACEGDDPYHALLRLEGEGLLTRPNWIVMTIDPDDLPPTGVRDSSLTVERFEAMARLVNRSRPADPGFYEKLKLKSRLVSLVDGRFCAFLRLERTVPVPAGSALPSRAEVRAIDVLLGRDTEALDAAWLTLERELARLGADARSLHSRVAVVVLPLPAQLRRPYPRARYQSRLERLCQNEGFLFVDPLPALRAEKKKGSRLYLPRLPYLGPVGHRIVAEQLLREIGTPLAHGESDEGDTLRGGE